LYPLPRAKAAQRRYSSPPELRLREIVAATATTSDGRQDLLEQRAHVGRTAGGLRKYQAGGSTVLATSAMTGTFARVTSAQTISQS